MRSTCTEYSGKTYTAFGRPEPLVAKVSRATLRDGHLASKRDCSHV